MKSFFAALLILAALSFAVMHSLPAEAQPRDRYIACPMDEPVVRDCVWDARHRGNGMGQSFYAGEGGRIWPLPHHIAHRLLDLPVPPR